MSTYSFLDVNASLVGPGGALNLGNGSGASEEGISIDPVSDTNAMSVGADGTPMHSLLANRAATITVRLLKTSPVNSKLMAMYNLQRASSSLHGNNTLTVVTTHGEDVVSCQSVAFKKVPTLNYQAQGGMNEWTFDAGYCDRALGDNY